MQRLALALSLVLSVTGTFACSDNGSDDGGGEETGGSSGSATGGSATGGSATGGSSGTSTGGSSTGGSGGSGTGGSATGGSGGGGFTKRGACGQKGVGTVTLTSYEATEEYYVISEEDLAEGLTDRYICHIRFDATRVGEAPPNCTDLDGVPCLWTHKIQISNPTVVTNVDGACESNERMWDAAWRAMQDGAQASYGYIDQYEGHNSVVMKAAGAAGSETWAVLGNASWLETGEFSFDNREPCRY